jgi:hypothetical protein
LNAADPECNTKLVRTSAVASVVGHGWCREGRFGNRVPVDWARNRNCQRTERGVNCAASAAVGFPVDSDRFHAVIRPEVNRKKTNEAIHPRTQPSCIDSRRVIRSFRVIVVVLHK